MFISSKDESDINSLTLFLFDNLMSVSVNTDPTTREYNIKGEVSLISPRFIPS